MNLRIIVYVLLLLISIPALKAEIKITSVANKEVRSCDTFVYSDKCQICLRSTELWLDHKYNYLYVVHPCVHFKEVSVKFDFSKDKNAIKEMISKQEAKIFELRTNIEHLETQLEMKCRR